MTVFAVMTIPVTRDLRGNGLRAIMLEVMRMTEDGQGGSLSGITENEAKEFHKYFMQGFLYFVGLTVFAHFLIWLWRPWF